MDGGLDHVEADLVDRLDGTVRADLGSEEGSAQAVGGTLPFWLDPTHHARCCPRCGSEAVCRWGRASPPRGAPSGSQRWRCRSCGRTYSTRTGTVLAGIHAPQKFRFMLADMLGLAPSSCRQLAGSLELDKMTIWGWRMKACAALAKSGPATSPQGVAADILVVRESRKASRMWVNHAREPHRYPKPDRLRWLDYRKRGMTPPDWQPRYRVPVQLTVDERGRCSADIRPPAGAGLAVSNGAAHSVATSCQSDRVGACIGPRHSAMRASCRSDGQTGRVASFVPQRDLEGSQSSSMGVLRSRFRSFLAPFCGPATSHLPAYTAWFTARLAAGHASPQCL
jgi:transposase-like protein